MFLISAISLNEDRIMGKKTKVKTPSLPAQPSSPARQASPPAQPTSPAHQPSPPAQPTSPNPPAQPTTPAPQPQPRSPAHQATNHAHWPTSLAHLPSQPRAGGQGRSIGSPRNSAAKCRAGRREQRRGYENSVAHESWVVGRDNAFTTNEQC